MRPTLRFSTLSALSATALMARLATPVAAQSQDTGEAGATR